MTLTAKPPKTIVTVIQIVQIALIRLLEDSGELATHFFVIKKTTKIAAIVKRYVPNRITIIPLGIISSPFHEHGA